MQKKSAKIKNLSVKYFNKDIRTLQFESKFDRIFLNFTAFGYFSDSINEKIISNISNHLYKDGIFCFDLWNRDNLLNDFLPYIVYEKGQDLMIDRHKYNPKEGRIYNDRIIIRNGIRKDKPFFVRLYNYSEINNILNKYDLKIIKTFGNWNSKESFKSNSKRMVIIAKKG